MTPVSWARGSYPELRLASVTRVDAAFLSAVSTVGARLSPGLLAGAKRRACLIKSSQYISIEFLRLYIRDWQMFPMLLARM